MLDMGAKGYMVASALKGVLAQRLVRKVCSSCAVDYLPSPGELAWLRMVGGADGEEYRFKRGAGCTYCNGTGHRGRMGVYELLVMDEALAEALAGANAGRFAQLARERLEPGGLVEGALDLARRGRTPLEEVIRLFGGPADLGGGDGPVPEAAGHVDELPPASRAVAS
jgi:MSHA biogenesis protein MshE